MTNQAPSAPDHGKEPPKYKLTEPAYIDDVYYDEARVNSDKGVTIYFEGVPGPHMKPLNAAAKAQVEKYKPGPKRNLIDELTRVAPDAPTAQPTHPGTPPTS